MTNGRAVREPSVQVELILWRNALRHPNGPASVVRHVLLTLSTWASSDGGSMYPSIEMLAIATGLHRETVRRATERAAAEGWIIRAARERSGARAGLRYSYHASVPRAFDAMATNGWETAWMRDPSLVSERRRRQRHRLEQGHVTAEGRDKNGRFGTVPRGTSPLSAGTVTAESRDTSPPRAGTVTAESRRNSSSTSSFNSSQTSRAREDDEGERRRKAEIAKKAGMDAAYISRNYGISP